ncbi:MAG: hypothetical protein R3C20_02750 [Planctomycetaceae bacterium]
MFVGPLDDPAAINTLLTESLCIALDNAITGCATAITITTAADDAGAATVRDDGPGFDVEIFPQRYDHTEIPAHATARRKAKTTLVNETLCGIGIFAGKRSQQVTGRRDGSTWFALGDKDYSCGKATGPIRKIEPAAEQWQQITFQPDPGHLWFKSWSSDYFSGLVHKAV